MHSPTHDATGSSPMTSITSLPEHLLITILEDDCIDRDDMVAVRLVCNTLSKAAAVLLFRRIRISQLKRDRDVFLSICNTPHLAQHVRDVEWQEVLWFPGYFKSASQMVASNTFYPEFVLEDDDTSQLCKSLDAIAADLFWLPVVPPESPDTDDTVAQAQKQNAAESFYEQFQQAIRQLPSLSTFISRPMHSERTLDWCEYPINIKSFRTHHPSQISKDHPFIPQTHDGLFLFLLPSVQTAASSITALVWEDDLVTPSYFRPPCPEAFKHLHTLVLSLTPRHFESCDNLAANLEAAQNVRNLSLAVQEGPSNWMFEYALLQFCHETDMTRWSRLRSLSLESMHKAAAGPLLEVVKHNADTLRHLHVSNCNFTLGRLKQLAEIPNLKLLSFSVHDFDLTDDVTTEEALLAFVNKEPETNGNYEIFHQQSKHAHNRTIKSVPSRKPVEDGDDDDDAASEEQASVHSDADSVDSLSHRIATAPKWVWGRYFDTYQGIYCYQVPDSNEHGKPTECWKFTSRDGMVSFGTDPLVYFDEWDLEAGDVEEPTPYCYEMQEVCRDSYGLDLDIMGPGSTAWELMRDLMPPEGAIYYDEEEGQLALSSM